MKLKISLLIALCNSGLLNTTEHDVHVVDAYKASKFRREVGKAIKDVIAREQELIKEAGDDAARRKELLDAYHGDEIDIPVTPMSYESFHALSKENRAVRVYDDSGKLLAICDPFRDFEGDLEGVLWLAPAE